MDFKKTNQRIALVDGNSFYCSCEQVMQPALEKCPLVVLSNNDGNVIARSNLAKELGIKMGTPWFQIQHLTHTHSLTALSANFSLYGDFSQRMMNVIGHFSPRQEIYSIDESFLDLKGISGTGREIGQNIKSRIYKWVGIPTCVGIGSTRTLAKLANHLAKKIPRLEGVCDLSPLNEEELLRTLRHVSIEDVWGVGRKLSPKLRNLNIHSAADLANSDFRVIRDNFSIVLAKTAQELRGISCLEWKDVPEQKKQIMCSRSFGQPVKEKIHLAHAISTFLEVATAKLRNQKSKAKAIYVFIRTSPFRKGSQYSGATIIRFLHSTNDTSLMTTSALMALDKIYRKGFNYTKAGICLLDLDSIQDPIQGNLFDRLEPIETLKTAALMNVIDSLNARYGKQTVSFATQIKQDDAPWQMKQERMTPAYTTNWDEIVEVWC